MRRNAIVVVLVTVLAVLGLAGPASATPVCVGRQGTLVLCVDPDSSVYLGCWYLGDDECTHVYAPAPAVSCYILNPAVCA